MRFIFSSRFKKSVRRRQRHIQELVLERLELFQVDKDHVLLNNHALGGPLMGTRSLSVSGDLRIHYEFISDEAVRLIDFGTHSELYG